MKELNKGLNKFLKDTVMKGVEVEFGQAQLGGLKLGRLLLGGYKQYKTARWV